MIALLVVLTVVEVVVLLSALVVYLVRIIGSLRRTSVLLAKVSFGVRAIETQCEPIGPSVLRINRQLEDVAAALDGLATTAEAQAGSTR